MLRDGRSRLFSNAGMDTLCFGRRSSAASFRTSISCVGTCCLRPDCDTTGRTISMTRTTLVRGFHLLTRQEHHARPSSEAERESFMIEPVRDQFSIYSGSMANAFNASSLLIRRTRTRLQTGTRQPSPQVWSGSIRMFGFLTLFNTAFLRNSSYNGVRR